MTSNQISENILVQVESEGKYFLFLNYIPDNWKDASTINKTNGFLTSKSGNLHAKQIGRVWDLQEEWKDSSV